MKQGSSDTPVIMDELYSWGDIITPAGLYKDAQTLYRRMLAIGVCPEQARMVLPQNMMTEFIETGSLAAYARLCNLRMGPDAQKEIQEVASQISAQLKSAFPHSWSTLVSEPSVPSILSG